MFYLFPSKLTEMHIVTKTNETNTNNKSFKEDKCCCNRKVVIEKKSFPSVLYFALHLYFRRGQECPKCDQIAALTKNTGDFIALSVFLSSCYFKMFVTSIPSI